MKNEELINKWLVDELSTEEEAYFKKTEDYQIVTKIWNGLSIARPPKFEVERELKNLKRSRQSQPVNSKVIHVSWHHRFVGIAASIFLFSLIGYFLFQYYNPSNVTTLSESQSILYLPDSSTVVLNKGSELTYNNEDWKANRQLTLNGEGYFEVKSGSTFEVKTSHGIVKVLGTSFNVKQRKNFYEVICFEGKVKVEAANDVSLLSTGKLVRLTEKGLLAFDMKLAEKPTWLNGKSSFYKTPFYAVLAELENQFDIKIETNNIPLESTFTGSFPNDNIKIALEAVTTPSSYSYQITDDKVLLSAEDI
jgi:ferric-dicitrate binding protein FerR (iron transport regulator)